MSRSFAVTLVAAGVAVALLGIVTGLVRFCMSHRIKHSNKNSDTGSSDPSAVVEVKRRAGPSSSIVPPLSGPHEARQFTMEELEQATKRLDEMNLIGYVSFGLVYKGLLRDGTVVAIKRRSGVPKQEFVEEGLKSPFKYIGVEDGLSAMEARYPAWRKFLVCFVII